MSWLLPKTHTHGPAGFWFCGCAGLPIVDGGGGGAAAQAASTAATKAVTKAARAPVLIGGRRARTVDVHAHCYFQPAIELMGADAKAVLPPVKGVPEHFLNNAADAVMAQRLAAMDHMGIDLQVLSINPFWYRKDRETTEAICRIHNESLAEICATHPKRFAAFASLAMQFPDLAVQQLEEAVKKYGLKGAAIGGSVAGDDFCKPQYHPVLAKAQELGVMLFIHPQSTPELQARFKGNGWLSNVIGNPLDTTIALQKLIFEGVFDKFPQLKVLGARMAAAFWARTRRAWTAAVSSRRRTATRPSCCRKSPPSTSARFTSTRWSSPARRCATWRPRWVWARSWSAPTTPSPGNKTPSAT